MGERITRTLFDDLTDETVAEDSPDFLKDYVFATNGTKRVVDILKTTLELVLAGKIPLADVLAKGRAIPMPKWYRNPENLSQAQMEWHYRVKRWAVDIDPATGNYNAAEWASSSNAIPPSLAGPAPKWMVERYTELFPEDEFPDPPKKK